MSAASLTVMLELTPETTPLDTAPAREVTGYTLPSLE